MGPMIRRTYELDEIILISRYRWQIMPRLQVQTVVDAAWVRLACTLSKTVCLSPFARAFAAVRALFRPESCVGCDLLLLLHCALLVRLNVVCCCCSVSYIATCPLERGVKRTNI